MPHIPDTYWIAGRCGCIVLAATAILPLLPVDVWWIRIGDFPRVQLLISYTMMLAVMLCFRSVRDDKWWMALMFGCAIVQVVKIYAWLPCAALEVQTASNNDPSTHVRILSANVLQDNEDYHRLLNLIDTEKPDVVALVEVNDQWMRELESLKQPFPHNKLHPLENKYGVALYSRLPLRNSEVRYLVSDEIPSIVATVELRNGRDVRLFVVHPNPPRPGEDTTKRDGELVLVGREVANLRDKAASKTVSAVVLGDMNDVGWSRTTDLFQEVSGLLDPRKGRGFYNTFDATSSIWRYPLDHLFHTDDFRVAEIRTLPSIGSDHFPLLVELSYEPDAAATQEAPNLDSGDDQDADDAVRDSKAAAKKEGQAVADG